MSQKDHLITFGSQSFPYTIVRTERSTVGISVEHDGEILVKAPLDLDEDIIHQTVQKKRKWIANKIADTTMVTQPVPRKQEPVSGEKIRYKNKLYRLKIHLYEKKRPRIILVCTTLHIYVNQELSKDDRSEVIKSTIIKWYKDKAQTLLSQRIQKYLINMNVNIQGMQIRETKLRWGSCTDDGKLIFNWRIIMAPISAIDYVVIHELCHLLEPNHSPSFWSHIEALQPSYRRWKEWLHVNGLLLDLRW